MEPTTIVVLISVLVVTGALFLAIRSSSRDTSLLQQQLIELRERLDGLHRMQREIPAEMNYHRARQAESLTEQFAMLQSNVTQLLESSQRTLNNGLGETSQIMKHVGERLGRLAESTRQLERLGETVVEIDKLLRVPKLRGTAGEVWLQELLRQVLPANAFEMQYRFTSGVQVDAVVRVEDRLIPIDSKFPLESFRRMTEGGEEESRHARSDFRRSVKKRIDEIADKYIIPSEGTCDFAVMYIPVEAVYYEVAVGGGIEDRGLAEYASSRRVILTSPNTLYAYLVALMHGLRSVAVHREAEGLLEMLAGLAGDFRRLRRSHSRVGRHVMALARRYDESDRHMEEMERRLTRIDLLSAGGEGARPSGDVPD